MGFFAVGVSSCSFFLFMSFSYSIVRVFSASFLYNVLESTALNVCLRSYFISLDGLQSERFSSLFFFVYLCIVVRFALKHVKAWLSFGLDPPRKQTCFSATARHFSSTSCKKLSRNFLSKR